jgi:hypothetical protein
MLSKKALGQGGRVFLLDKFLPETGRFTTGGSDKIASHGIRA